MSLTDDLLRFINIVIEVLWLYSFHQLTAKSVSRVLSGVSHLLRNGPATGTHDINQGPNRTLGFCWLV